MNEIWKPIPGLEPIYEASNLGRVRSLRFNKILRQHTDKDGYLHFTAWIRDKNKRMSVHRAVLSAFAGVAPENTMCCHKDGNKTNNIIENLRWDTAKANVADAIAIGMDWGAKAGEKHPLAILSSSDVIRIREARLFGAKIKQLANSYGVSQSAIKNVYLGHRWKHLTNAGTPQ